nr:agglutinin biogenesis protein MshP [uncultured Duganella sp.]
MNTSTYMRLGARGKSAGVAIITAIFLLVVVAGLGVAIVSLTSAQQDASARDYQAQRAYQAAKAGVEWAAYRGLRELAPARPAKVFNCETGTPSAPVNVALPAATLATFTVTVRVTCTDAPAVGDGSVDDPTGWHIAITSTACTQPDAAGLCPNANPGPDYVQRVINAQL